MIAFDDTRTLIDRPFSLWERIHGETLGVAQLTPDQTAVAWYSVGCELANLHSRVQECFDPNGYLDNPLRNNDLDASLRRLVEARKLDPQIVESTHRLAEVLRPSIGESRQTRFIHDDVHALNIMCSTNGKLLALLDWGDAGWGDPSLDFAGMPFDAIPFALAGYEAHAPGLLGPTPKARIAWYKLLDALEHLCEDQGAELDVDAYWRFVQSG